MISGNGGIASGSGTYDHGSVVLFMEFLKKGLFSILGREKTLRKNSLLRPFKSLVIKMTANFSIKEVEKNILTIRSSPTYSGTTNGSGADDQETNTFPLLSDGRLFLCQMDWRGPS